MTGNGSEVEVASGDGSAAGSCQQVNASVQDARAAVLAQLSGDAMLEEDEDEPEPSWQLAPERVEYT